ncbi:MAG: Glu-tRNA(Gln) amidotransferase subunit GatE [Candidatus Pacearchaeota archaeon]|nr:Glu-tRNA(Gln) amidotransferase subunit GatE [Candidatus Pacearchaeota archaeon]
MIDYQKIGLKSGLEIHQQLDTHKLFCLCPSVLKQSEPDMIVKRKIKAVTGETGKIDEAAAFEQAREREFEYEFYKDANCLVELDESPPHTINHEALKIALQIALLLNCEMYPIVQVMRKTVIDGSNTSGFQRTVLIAHNGFIETSQGKVGIDYVMLEEDAARPAQAAVSSEGVDEPGFESSKRYKLDRLGIPLVEIATAADLHSAEQIKEAAMKIGEILRACKVKRGIGTIRQDVNVSIKGSERVEIKGFQDPKMMIRTIDLEIERQQKCIKEKSCKKEVRKANPDGTTIFLRPMPGAARMYPETDLSLIEISNEFIKEIKKELPRLKEEISLELKEQGLNPELTKLILAENKLEEFKALLQTADKPNLAAKLLVLLPKEISSHEKIPMEEVNEKINIDVIETVFQEIVKGKVPESAAKQIMIDIIHGKNLNNIIKEMVSQSSSSENIENDVQDIIKSKSGLTLNAYMGLVMAKFRGKVDAGKVMEILKKYVKS